MTVWIIQQPRPNARNWQPDFSSAEKYGEFRFVYDSHEKVYALPNPSMHKASRLLKEFNYETDYLLWPNIGDPQAMFAFMFGFCLTHLGNIDYVNVLQWNRKREEDGTRDPSSGFYVPVRYNFKAVKVD